MGCFEDRITKSRIVKCNNSTIVKHTVSSQINTVVLKTDILTKVP